MDILKLIAGGALLLFAGDYLVRGAVGLSSKMNLSPALVGLTVVALGTSAPELVICIQAALDGVPDIATGSVVGSNIANILLVLGVAALITPILDVSEEIRRNTWIMVGASAAILVIGQFGVVGRITGAVMVLVLGYVLFDAYRRGSADAPEGVADAGATMRWSIIAAMIGFGIIGLPIGANFFIEGARSIAESFGVSKAAIGLTLVAIGTSLPELAATVMAATRGNVKVALANAIGSNLFNILGILGLTAIVTPVPVAQSIRFESLPIMVAVSIALLTLLIYAKPIGRAVGGIFVLGYCGFALISLSS